MSLGATRSPWPRRNLQVQEAATGNGEWPWLSFGKTKTGFGQWPVVGPFLLYNPRFF